MLSVEGLQQYYGESHTLWDIELTVERGACVCVIGRNGVGKTTLLRAIMGLVPVAAGSIRFAGRELSRSPAERRARLGIGYVPQGRDIFARLTVEENLRVGSIARRHAARGLDEVFRWFPALSDVLSRRGGDLSGGQQQQLAIGRALALRPSLLVLDEPTEGIQPNVVQLIGDVIAELRAELGMTVLLVEQKLAFARRLADHFAMVDRGRVVAAGRIEELDDELVERHLRV